MNNNLFSERQIEYLYSDAGFLSFVNQYFSSFSTCIHGIPFSSDQSKANDADMGIYMRVVLANIDNLYVLISNLDHCLSMVNTNKEIRCGGMMQGRLKISEYTRKSGQIGYPKEYPCIVKSKTYVTPENVYVIFIIKNIIGLLDLFKRYLKTNVSRKKHRYYSEFQMIEKYMKSFMAFSGKAYFAECRRDAEQIKKVYGDGFPRERYNTIYNRMRKGKIRNVAIYQKIFDWYHFFRRGSVVGKNIQRTGILRYSEDFSNKLFELWCLYGIKESFVSDFGAVVLEEHDLMGKSGGCVYKLAAPAGGILKIYYQKGTGLYWRGEDDLSWKYEKDGILKGLRGIPDISVRYIREEDCLVMIDVKNRVRNAGDNTEEIYKMIGYFSNFKKSSEEYFNKKSKKQGALLFRNDVGPYEETLVSDMGHVLKIFSIGAENNHELNKAQFKRLCKYILDVDAC